MTHNYKGFAVMKSTGVSDTVLLDNDLLEKKRIDSLSLVSFLKNSSFKTELLSHDWSPNKMVPC